MAKWNNLTNVTFDEIQPGASASLLNLGCCQLTFPRATELNR